MSAAALNVLREVRLYGPLRARFGRSHWLAVKSPAEAVHALCMLFDGFREAVLGHKGPGYRVLVGEGARTDVRDERTLTLAAGAQSVIRIAPVIHGNKRGWGQVVVGAVLVAAGAYFNQPWLVKIGAGLILGGAVQLLSPQRNRSGSQADKETSYAFNGPVNVTSPGGPVPLIIGRMIVGSVVVSSGLSTDEYQPAATSLPASPTLPADEPVDWLAERDAA